ncbi:class I SAM-dependent methyltransferase [Chroogloeocystis siderophila]|jgi:SAM-dependent methyltransferase|uniref:SAM-dependent methyltransferase n=1 Tax=Chroogloeocystis siderophila 5.2 s.c.1 TaxID=247279 RepID=A0A1U7HIK9_9CHRO|nr:class I SAM-dependent methyltransferase [Chroogloeocystis siderophila]OKH23394.1 SAM-dependent methyltransferase [Chroogloeocystis siderophila 5.2 s.c.1]
MLWSQLKLKILQFVVLCCAVLISCTPIAATSSVNSNSTYQYRTIHSPDGIGKFYQGREIAKVMGHTEALWLERPSREREEQPQKVLDALVLQPSDVVADVGAGTGYFSFRMAQRLPNGKVLAVDIQPEMLDIIEFLKKETEITNIETILGTLTNPNLPENSIDLALMVDAYHEFSHPYEVMQGITKALKLGGRVVLVEYRKENPFIPIKGLHKMTQNQVKKEMAMVGLQWQNTDESLPNQHIITFAKTVSQELINKNKSSN